jgi:hypothetical protein
MCRNCLLKHIIEGKTEERIKVTGRRGRKRIKLLYYLKERRVHSKLKEQKKVALSGELALEEDKNL